MAAEPGPRSRERLTGLAVIAVAVLSVTVLTVLQRPAVAGVAVVPAPPRPGDCVQVDDADPLWRQQQSDAMPVLVARPCTGGWAGEVVSVRDGSTAGPQGGQGGQDCLTPARSYLGAPLGPADPAGSTGPSATTWTARSTLTAQPFGPSALQLAAGQQWSACVLLGTDPVDFGPEPLTGTARDAAGRGGRAFDRFAFCSDSPLLLTAAPCEAGHRWEVIGDAITRAPREADSLTSCRAEVSRRTGLADPSAGGRLRVELMTFLYDSDHQSFRRATYQRASTDGGAVTCVVSASAPDEQLTGTLIGLAGRPLPIG